MASLVRRAAARLRGAGGRDTPLVLPRRTMASSAYAATGQARWTVVEPATTLHRRPPVHHGSLPSGLLERVVPDLPDLGVLDLAHGITAGPYGWIVTPDGHLLPDHAFHGPGTRRRRTQQFSGRTFDVERVTGTALSIATYAGWKNYAHFLLDSVTRLHLAEAAGFPPGSVDHVIVGVPNDPARRILERLGVTPDRMLETRDGIALRPERLIAPSFPGLPRNYPPWVPTYLRERLVPAGLTRHRRLYLPRTRARRILNIDELMPMLLEHGFEVFDPELAVDPISTFAEATVVVAGHGAALAGLAFCAPGTAVLEVLPSGHQMPYYYTLAESAGLHYGYLIAASVPEGSPPGLPVDKVDMRVDAAAFREALEATLERAGVA